MACPLCALRADVLRPTTTAMAALDCPHCGKCHLSLTVVAEIGANPRRANEWKRVGFWVREQNVLGLVPEIKSADLIQIVATPPPLISERLDRLLIELVRDSEGVGFRVKAFEPKFMAIAHANQQGELVRLVRALAEAKYVSHTEGSGDVVVEVPGYIQVESLMRRRPDSRQVFVAMWFDERMVPIYEQGIAPGIIASGMTPLMINRKEHVERIDDQIMLEIRKSRFVVADFTGHRSGVYFEAGFAIGLGIPVVWTCRKDELNTLHFDIRQYNMIDWQTPDELRLRLAARLEALATLPQ